jgi:hypothetical protein
VVVDPAFDFAITSAQVRYNRKFMGDVTVNALLNAPLPAPSDVIAVSFDGIPLAEVPFAEFNHKPNGSWHYSNAGLVIELDPANQSFVISSSSKTDLSTLDNSNGVEVTLSIGNRSVVETITLVEGKGNRWVYLAPTP